MSFLAETIEAKPVSIGKPSDGLKGKPWSWFHSKSNAFFHIYQIKPFFEKISKNLIVYALVHRKRNQSLLSKQKREVKN
ncbi:MAG: hypothetical protein ACOCYO_05990 [Bacteroidota bacterium]